MTGAARRARLVVIGTPIGNLGDLSPRARDALAGCHVVACEDTRRTGRLLELSGIDAPKLLRLDEHMEPSVAPGLVERALEGSLTIGLVSDAGMPGLSDPGSILVSLAIEAGVDVEVVPGPFAAAVALVASGLLGSDSRFVFEGFLPRKAGERRRRLVELSTETRTIVLYESPHRVVATLDDISAVFGPERRAAVCRELTKMHEEILRGAVGELSEGLRDSKPKGEIVLVIDGAEPPEGPEDAQLLDSYEKLVEQGYSSRDALTEVATQFGVGVNNVKHLVYARGS